ncbi:MAG: glycine cleavage system protein GcvH [Chloroflexota bacterium]|nr:MAG: glycine cleavage system protein GcvH [Chloroflexota bacterium]
MSYPNDVKYAASHEWVKVDGDTAIVGISDYAQDALGDIVFVELPTVGMELKAGDAFGVVESVKAASDVYMPIGGAIAATNDALKDAPETVNSDAFGAGWLLKVFPYNAADLDKLMDAATYKSKIESGEIH